MATFGENLKALRKSRGYSQEKFAETVGSTQAAITAWERNTRIPNVAMIRHIANTFRVPVSSLIPMGSNELEDDYVREIADVLQRDPKIRLLFDRTKYMNESDLDAVICVVNAITRERDRT